MTASYTSTLTQPPLTPYDGLSALSNSQAMDVGTHGQRLAEHNRDPDIMDTTIDSAENAPSKGKATDIQPGPDAPATKEDVSAATGPSQVLERPREGGDGARESPLQKPTIPPPQKPPLRANLISLYGLQPLAASVARFHPVTGEKINKLRKSYEGQLKTLGLAGRNRPVKHDPEKGMGLRDLTLWPEEEWQNQKVAGKDVHTGLPASALAKLDKAMQMQPGPVPNNSMWEDQLGHEKIKPTGSKTIKVPQKAPTTTSTKTNGQVNGTTTDGEAIRPKRTGRKRRYDEHSFEGYGEGYVDDDLDLDHGGYSSGDTQFSRRSSTNKKRKKDYLAGPTGYGDRAGSFSSNMAGVTTYGR